MTPDVDLAMRVRKAPCGARIAWLLIPLLLLGCADKSGEPSLPPDIGGLKLLNYIEGKDALRAINRLHGKEVGSQESYIGYYQGEGASATLYVSESSNNAEAQRLLDSMTEKIRAGGKLFGHFRQLDRGGRPIYSVFGLGQVHFYYRDDSKVIWLAVDPSVAEKTLSELISK